jgi:amino-acid N-acetyltransferase
LKIQKACIDDVPQIHRMINHFADKDEMLPRALSELYENLRDLFVVRDDTGVIACASLHIYWEDMAEIRGVAVTENSQGQDIGASLAKACIDEARELHIPTIFCLTYKPAFFERLGFRPVDKMNLPRKVWAECYTCPKFPNCDEVALIYEVSSKRGDASK